MAHDSQSSGRLAIALATDRDREDIHRICHEIYSRELRQQGEDPHELLSDPLDALNACIVASRDGEITGFVGITPPGQRYSIEEHLSLADLPFPIDDGLYEVRWLAVVEPYRGRGIATLLMYAALRWVEDHGGRRIIAIGRSEVEGVYLKAGLQPLVRRVRAGAVTFELMTATVEALRLRADCRIQLLARLVRSADWRLDIPPYGRDPGPRPARAQPPGAVAGTRAASSAP